MKLEAISSPSPQLLIDQQHYVLLLHVKRICVARLFKTIVEVKTKSIQISFRGESHNEYLISSLLIKSSSLLTL
jgi:hypothetical protein